MKCVFLDEDGDKCHAELRESGVTWKVDKETRGYYCITPNFPDCPRYRTKMEVLTKSR